MERIGSTELKNQVGRVLALVERGEEVLLTRRGRPVARIIPVPARSRSEVVADLMALRSQQSPVPVEQIQTWLAEGRDQ